jgi:AcrR family transcriptional regulator
MATARSRSDEDKQARREAILDAAEEAFREQRFDQTAMDAIAKSAGLSRALLYVYFRDKADIHLGLCVRAGQVLYRRMQSYVGNHQRGIDQVRALGAAYVDFYHHDGDYFQIMVQGTGLSGAAREDGPGEAQEAMQDMEMALMTLMTEAIQRGLDDGTIRADAVQDPLETAMFLRSTLHGAILVQDTNGSPIFKRGRLSRTRLLSYTVDRLMAALT